LTNFFEYLDSEPFGIYSGRWGDSPIRNVMLSYFWSPSHVIRFCNLIYHHSAEAAPHFQGCPIDRAHYVPGLDVNSDDFYTEFNSTIVIDLNRSASI